MEHSERKSARGIGGHVGRLVVGLVLLVIGSATGILVDRWQRESDSRLRFVDWRTTLSTNPLTIPILDQDLEVRVDGDLVEEITVATAQLFNYSDQDYDELDVFIDVVSTDGDSVRPLAVRAVGPNDLSAAVQPLAPPPPPVFADTLRYAYKVLALNRQTVGSFPPAFHLTVVTEGTGGEVRVRSRRAGVADRDRDENLAAIASREESRVSQRVYWVMGAGVLFFLIGFLLPRGEGNWLEWKLAGSPSEAEPEDDAAAEAEPPPPEAEPPPT